MSNSEQRGHFIQNTPMVTAPHIASPGPAAEPCNVYTGGSIVARVSCVPLQYASAAPRRRASVAAPARDRGSPRAPYVARTQRLWGRRSPLRATLGSNLL